MYIKLLAHYDNYDLPLGSIYKVKNYGHTDVFTEETGFIPFKYVKILDIREFVREDQLTELPKEVLVSGVIDLQNEIVKLKESLRYEKGIEKRYEKRHTEAIDKYDRLIDLVNQMVEISEE